MTPEERYQWLYHWLISCEEDGSMLRDHHVYQRIAFFQIAFYLFSVFKDQTTQEYLWYVSENYHFDEEKFLHSVRFASLDDLLRRVAYEWPRVPIRYARTPLPPL